MTRKERIEYWQSVIEAHQGSNKSAASFCRQRKISPQSFYWWRNRLRRELDENSKAAGFVELRRGFGTGIELRIGEVKLRVDPQFDAGTLTRVLDILRRWDR